jgi:FixJ family two-component response regulator
MTNSDAAPEVFLVDDDPLVCKALSRGLAAEGFRVRTWESALAFLRDHDPETPGCLVTDIVMPGLNGIELQSLLCARGSGRPIVFITGKGSIQLSVRAMRAGAVSFLPKPVHLAELAAVVREAFDQDARARQRRSRREAAKYRLTTLTPREREVLELVVAGQLNKQIAARLGAAEKTVKVHRRRVMRKMNARSVAELVVLSSTAGVSVEPSERGR